MIFTLPWLVFLKSVNKWDSIIRLMMFLPLLCWIYLTHWGRGTHICYSKIIIIGSHNDLSLGRNQCCNIVNWTLWINFSEILIEINRFSFSKMQLKMSSAKWRLFRLGYNDLRQYKGILFFSFLRIKDRPWEYFFAEGRKSFSYIYMYIYIALN